MPPHVQTDRSLAVALLVAGLVLGLAADGLHVGLRRCRRLLVAGALAGVDGATLARAIHDAATTRSAAQPT